MTQEMVLETGKTKLAGMRVGRVASGAVSARLLSGLDEFERSREAMGREGAWTVFQNPKWLAAWHETMGRQSGVEPLFVEVRSDVDQEPLLLLPLVRSRVGGLMVIQGADLGVSDYNAPVLSRSLSERGENGNDLMRAIKRVLPAADLLSLERMAVDVDGVHNPLAEHGSAVESRLFGSVVVLADGWDAYLQARGKKFRKETKRCMGHLARQGEAVFELLRDDAAIRQAFAALEAQQRERMAGLGMDYRLDEPHVRDFYKRLLDLDEGQSFARVYVLSVDDVQIGIVFCVAQGDTIYWLRIAHAQGKWQQFGPGRLSVINTMKEGVSDGYCRFDMTIGDYAFKRSFRPERFALVDLTLPLTWRGLPATAKARLRPIVRRWRERKTANDAAATGED